MAKDSPGAVVVDSTLETVLRALSGGPGRMAAGDDAPVMIVVFAREADRFADTLDVHVVGRARRPT
jgi:hypothetical protein